MTAMDRVFDIVPHWAERAPDRVALRETTRNWTYRELNAAIGDAAAQLTASGVRGGDRVMLVCENCAAAVALYFACTVIGAWPIVVNARLTEREIEEIRPSSVSIMPAGLDQQLTHQELADLVAFLKACK